MTAPSGFERWFPAAMTGHRLWQHQPVRSATYLLATAIVIALGWLVLRGGGPAQFAHYPPLHTALEVMSIIVSALVFLVSCQGTQFRGPRNLSVIGAAFLGVAALDLMHALSYEGMPVWVTPSSQAKAINFWLVARVLAIGALLFGAYARWDVECERTHHHTATLAVLLGVALLAWTVLFHPMWWPQTFVPGSGLTRFAIVSELLLALAAAIAAVGYYRALMATERAAQRPFDAAALLAACATMAVSGLLSAVDTDVGGVLDLVGHALKIVAAWFICHGLVAPNLRDIHTLHDLALAAARIGSWQWDARTGRLVVDATARELIGGQPDQAQPASAGASPHADDIETVRRAWASALDPGGTGDLQVEFRVSGAADRDDRFLAVRGRTEMVDGRPRRVIGIVRDVTDRRQVEQAQNDISLRVEGIVSIAVDAIISMDENQRITMFNKGAENIFGYSREEIIGEPLTKLMPDRFRAAHPTHVSAFSDAGVSARRMSERTEILGQRKSGETFFAEASISKLDIAGQRIFTAVLRDITERKQSQTALEREVETRTRELKAEMQRREESQSQLVRTQRMEAFGQLTGGVAHDFNNLLTVITGNLELLEMRLKDSKERALLQRAQDAAEMGGRLTGRLLTFARRRRYAPNRLILNEQVLGMAELLERTLGEQITLTTTLEKSLWTAIAEPSEIENAILNLAINARDAMPNGGRLVIETANVTVDAERSVQGVRLPIGDYVRLSVTDTGTGMSKDVQGRAFEPFFTTKGPGKGTGLGLSTIYGFVQQLRGAVALYSETGKGTTISIYLPRAGDVSARASDAVAAAGTAIAPAQGERVLLVEDNAEVRATAVSQLETLGYAVIEADSGAAAIACLERDASIAIVFSDVVMAGGMSGFDVVRWVRANRPQLRVLLASGYPDEVLLSEDTRHLRVEVMRKPYSRQELAAALRRALAR